ncbi:3-ketoacyl-ACP reductase [Micromonospora qiuiae]|uniref:3-ketoacyl-ACP reductase n=1 Tax=Micromonospora qiuiae TaxID=502268 RepID=A0ABQ4J829_9ACTN|nr:SDR family NAD(P)-dependent oxidoreductase [Micromonospora qiuiae]GIJ26329.1 3-ketoacyl-ACP reductase [Micromonospora qiuiae]
MELNLNDKITVITGAASGIGRASAMEFASLGATVVVSDIDAQGAEATVGQIRQKGGTAVAVAADVMAQEQVAALINTAVERFGRLDVLFNNAGGAQPEPTHEMSPAEFRRVVELNLFSMFYGVHAALPVMMAQRSGTILSTTSGAGLGAVPGLAAYGAAKAGMIALTRNIAAEYGQYGIRANVISPGSMDTVGFRIWLDSLPGSDQDYFSQIPSGRLGTAEDIARVAAFLASDYSAYVNGVTVPVDGGIAGVLAIPRV